VKYELTEVQVRNLGEFLMRVPLKAPEAAAFVELARALNNPIKEVKEKDEKTGDTGPGADAGKPGDSN